MTLRIRILLMVTSLLATTVLVTTSVLVMGSRRVLLAHTKADAILIAQFPARMTRFTQQVEGNVEDAIGEHMVAQATLTSHLVAIAEQAGMSPEDLNQRLRAIAAQTVLDEFQVTNERGQVYLYHAPDSTNIQFQDTPFWSLLTGEQQVVQQEAHYQQNNRL